MNNDKKNILFISHELQCGGAEKALVSLLQVIDYDQYNVYLQLFWNRGLFLNQLHEKVVLLPAPIEFQYFDMPIKSAIVQCLKSGRIDVIYNRIMSSVRLKFEDNVYRKEQRNWKYMSRCIPKLAKKFDYAVGCIEKGPNYYCVEKVDAVKKLGWIHNDYDKMQMSTKIDLPFFEKIDYIFTDAEECKLVLEKNFQMFEGKFQVLKNIVSPKLINKLAQEAIEPPFAGFKLISVGRFSAQKGYDMAIDAMRIVKDKGFDFNWIILGDGELREEIKGQIVANNLSENIQLLGIKENHYPYVKQADLFMQTSRFEGKSISIDEAKILNKPILVTNFSTVKDQITDNETGIIADMNANSIADKVIELITNKNLRDRLSHNLSLENNGTEDEIEKFYQFLN
ncbi:glycosyltransferase [Flavobacterium sp. F-380]|uniref:Glycosyltransferase n=1 Tax=Flavobacterium kayseriense TaxID=2764714 RepID=A0ABR7J7F2_9FLAO|nr:glycosyltransferase [Flavobacterium kayseriense]MBC5841470.1 glycosyltransferase [Flavobacterium kayseriense]MBC5847998.1 glycosyltransferase [Flavobacterium kayseriense]